MSASRTIHRTPRPRLDRSTPPAAGIDPTDGHPAAAPIDHRTLGHGRDRVGAWRRGRRSMAMVALVAAGALGLAACSSSTSSSAPISSSAPASSSVASSTATNGKAPASFHLSIKNFAFHPADFTVAPGATITVTNEDSVDHTFTARNRAFNTGDIAPGQTVTVKAPTTPGTYPYFCLIHQFMTGVLTVS
jgi:plastocyanin